MAGGSVQDVASGLVLRKVDLRASAAGDRLTIDRLTASDPTGGTLSGKGGMRLLAGGGLGYDVTIDTKKLRLLDNTLGVVDPVRARWVPPVTSPRHSRAASSRSIAPTSRFLTPSARRSR